VLYKNQEIDIRAINYSEGVAIIPLSDDSIVCIPEDGATAEELELIQQIRDDVESRPAFEPVIAPVEPTTEEYLVDLDFRVSMIKLGL
jgi:hypothetical protein